MKNWIPAAMALALLAIPFEAASARGGRGGGGGRAGRAGPSISTGPRARRGNNKKDQARMRERIQAENRDALLRDAERDRI
jgi:hypothetical protein